MPSSPRPKSRKKSLEARTVALRRPSTSHLKVCAFTVSTLRAPPGPETRRSSRIRHPRIHSSPSLLSTSLPSQRRLRLMRAPQLAVASKSSTPRRHSTHAPSTSIQSVTINTLSLEYGSVQTPLPPTSRRNKRQPEACFPSTIGNSRVSPFFVPRNEPRS